MFTIKPKIRLAIEATTDTPIEDDSFFAASKLPNNCSDRGIPAWVHKADTAIFVLETTHEDIVKTINLSISAVQDPHFPDVKIAYAEIVSRLGFCPMKSARLIRHAESDDLDIEDDDCDDWRSEIAMQAGMMGGTAAYNEVMGYDEGYYYDEDDY